MPEIPELEAATAVRLRPGDAGGRERPVPGGRRETP